MPDAVTFGAIVVLVFVMAGLVKGVIGMGLPTVALGLLTAFADLSVAMALMLAPSFVTNVVQGVVGGHFRTILRQHWTFLICATAFIWLGSMALISVDLSALSALLGGLLVVYGIIGLAGVRLQISDRQQGLAGPTFGAVNGTLTGMTGSFIVPGVLYLQATGLSRDALIQAMGILFTLSTVGLAVALQGQNLLTRDQSLLSLAAILPALAGMWLGQRLRHNLSEAMFRRVFQWSVIALGCYLVLRWLMQPG